MPTKNTEQKLEQAPGRHSQQITEKKQTQAVGPCQQRHLAKTGAGCWTQLANKTEPKHKQTGGHNQQIRRSQNTNRLVDITSKYCRATTERDWRPLLADGRKKQETPNQASACSQHEMGKQTGWWTQLKRENGERETGPWTPRQQCKNRSVDKASRKQTLSKISKNNKTMMQPTDLIIGKGPTKTNTTA